MLLRKSWGNTYCKQLAQLCLRWFEHVWRIPIEVLVRRVDQMKTSPIARGQMKSYRQNHEEGLKGQQFYYKHDS